MVQRNQVLEASLRTSSVFDPKAILVATLIACSPLIAAAPVDAASPHPRSSPPPGTFDNPSISAQLESFRAKHGTPIRFINLSGAAGAQSYFRAWDEAQSAPRQDAILIANGPPETPLVVIVGTGLKELLSPEHLRAIGMDHEVFGKISRRDLPGGLRLALDLLGQALVIVTPGSPLERPPATNATLWQITAVLAVLLGLIAGFASRFRAARKLRIAAAVIAVSAQIIILTVFWEGGYALVYSTTLWGLAMIVAFAGLMTGLSTVRTKVAAVLIVLVTGFVVSMVDQAFVAWPSELWSRFSMLAIALTACAGIAVFDKHNRRHESVSPLGPVRTH